MTKIGKFAEKCVSNDFISFHKNVFSSRIEGFLQKSQKF